MWPADRQIHPGQLHSPLGLHLGHHQHHGLTRPLLGGLQPGQQAGQAAARGLPGGGERYRSPVHSSKLIQCRVSDDLCNKVEQRRENKDSLYNIVNTVKTTRCVS